MTVIAYSSKHRVMASDSRVSEGTEYHVTNARKIFRLKSGALVGLAGAGDDRDFFSLLEKATPRRMPSRKQIADLSAEVAALIVFPKGQVWRVCSEFDETSEQWLGEVLPISDPIVAIGSGAAYAYGAMEAGQSPTAAVRIACRRDLMCALPVQWEGLSK